MAESAPEIITLQLSRSGKMSGKIGEMWLASKYDPVKEAEVFVKGQNILPGMNVALYGIGLGYHIRPLLDAVGPDGKVVVAEANISILKMALKVIDDPAIFDYPNLGIVSGRSEGEFLAGWSEALSGFDTGKTRVVIHNPSFQALPDGYGNSKNSIELIKMERRFPLLMGESEKLCFRRNLKKALRSPGIANLAGALRGGVVAVVGAGPSLDKTIMYLAAEKNLTIFASDTSLPALLDAGVTPDFVVTVDSQPHTTLHFLMADRFDIPMITLPTSNSDVIERWEGPLFFGYKNPEKFKSPAREWAESMGKIESGGSVSCVALEMAIKMGASVILLFGQEFGYPDGKAYASCTVPHITGQKLTDESEMTCQVDYFGRNINVPINFHSYRRVFEELARSSDAQVVTLSPEGQRLDGVCAVVSPAPWMNNTVCKPKFTSFAGISKPAAPDVERAFSIWLDQ